MFRMTVIILILHLSQAVSDGDFSATRAYFFLFTISINSPTAATIFDAPNTAAVMICTTTAHTHRLQHDFET